MNSVIARPDPNSTTAQQSLIVLLQDLTPTVVNKFGLDIFIPGNWILNRIFVEADLIFNIRTLTDENTTTSFEDQTYRYSEMGVLSNFSNGRFFKAGIGFLF